MNRSRALAVVFGTSNGKSPRRGHPCPYPALKHQQTLGTVLGSILTMAKAFNVKPKFSLKKLLVVMAVFAGLLGLNRLVEDRSSRFERTVESKQVGLISKYKIDRQQIELGLPYEIHYSEITQLQDILLLRRKYVVRYSGIFESGQFMTFSKNETYVVGLFSSGRRLLPSIN